MAETTALFGIRLQATATGKEALTATAKGFDNVGKHAKGAATTITKEMKDAAAVVKQAGGSTATHWTKQLGAVAGVVSTLGNTLMTAFKIAATVAVGAFRAILGAAKMALGFVERILSGLLGLARTLAGHLGSVALQLGKVGGALAAVGLALSLAGGVKATSVFAEFEQSVRNAMTTTGLFGAELTEAEAKMSALARVVGAGSTFKASDVGEAFYALASAGMDVNQVMSTTPGLMALAEATLEPIGSTAELVTAALKSFRLEASETGRVVNVLAAAVSASPLDMSRLAESMKYVAPVASVFGQSIEDVTAALSVLSQVGIHGSEAGTALRAIMLRSVAPRGPGGRQMKAAGLSPESMNPKNVGMGGMISGLGQIMDKQGIGGLSKLVGLEGTAAAAALATAGAGAFEKMRDKITGTNLAFQMQALQLETVSGQWQIFTSMIEEAQHSFAEAARGGVVYLLKSLQDLMQTLTQAGLFSAAGEVFGYLAAALGDVGRMMAQYAPAFKMLGLHVAQVFLTIIQYGAQNAPRVLRLFMQLLARLPALLTTGMALAMNLAEWVLNRLPTLLAEGFTLAGNFLMWLSGGIAKAGEYLRGPFQSDVASAVDTVFDLARGFITLGEVAQGVLVGLGTVLELSLMQPLDATRTLLTEMLASAAEVLSVFARIGGNAKEAAGFSTMAASLRATESDYAATAVRRREALAAAGDTSWATKARGALDWMQPRLTSGLQRAGQFVGGLAPGAAGLAQTGAQTMYTIAGAFDPNQQWQMPQQAIDYQTVIPTPMAVSGPQVYGPSQRSRTPAERYQLWHGGGGSAVPVGATAGGGTTMVFHINGLDRQSILSAVGQALDRKREQDRRDLFAR